MTRSIYEQHTAAFSQVEAYVIQDDGSTVALVSIKYPRDGAGRLTMFVHWLGLPMVKGTASGYGYDKASGAASSAAKMAARNPEPEGSLAACFWQVMGDDSGVKWHARLERAGFSVVRAL